ncbi:MAG TPA: hypothetical protein ENO10_07505, partial [Salinimicrobium catena]|nr:hypothetical protein [Salinimicrobium catena]
MKKVTFYVLVFLMSFTILPTQAQEKTTSEKIEVLKQEKEAIISEEKEALKKEVERINERYEKKEVDWEEAEKLKSEAAKKHALNIQNRVAIIDNQLALLEREDDAMVDENEDWEDDEDDWHKSRYSRTTTHLVLAAGFNNALLDGQSINDSDFKAGGSRFFEIGLAWRTRVFEESNWLRFRYGFS